MQAYISHQMKPVVELELIIFQVHVQYHPRFHQLFLYFSFCLKKLKLFVNHSPQATRRPYQSRSLVQAEFKRLSTSDNRFSIDGFSEPELISSVDNCLGRSLREVSIKKDSTDIKIFLFPILCNDKS